MIGDTAMVEAWLPRLSRADAEPLLSEIGAVTEVSVGTVDHHVTRRLARMVGDDPTGWRLLATAAVRLVLDRYGEASRPPVTLLLSDGRELALAVPVDRSAPVSSLLNALHADLESAAPYAWTDRVAVSAALDVAGVSVPLDLAVRLADDPRIEHGIAVVVDRVDDAVTIRIDAVDPLPPFGASLAMCVAAALTSIATDPHQTCSDVDVLGADQRATLRAWSGPERPQPFQERTLIDVLGAAAVAFPDNEALCDADRSWTHDQLSHHVEAGARLVRDRSGVSGGRVAVLLPRGPELVIAILSILRAGASYVPLDPSHPKQRLARQLRLSEAHTVIGDGSMSGEIPTVITASELMDVESSGISPDLAAPKPDDEAILFFTSGSTGQPRPVAISHRQIAHKAVAAGEWADFDSSTRFALVSAISADALTYQIVTALAVGGTAVCLPAGGAVEPDRFWADMDKLRVTALNCVPSLLSALAEALPPGTRRPLRHCLLGGDEIPVGLLPRLSDRLDVEVFGNLYGPTEATVEAVSHRITGPEWPRTHVVPIGRPSPGFTVEVLTSDGEPTPVGVPGEMVIIGPGVAAGYLDDEPTGPGRFVPAPGRPDVPSFRTGDRARWRSDGVLEFLGRGDSQIQIHGNRVEPGEIEAALIAITGVTAAAVVPHIEPGAAVRVIAAYVADGLTAADVRSALAASVPKYMVPSSLLELDALPLTVHGKVDRREIVRLAMADDVRWEPDDAVGERVLRVWTDVLGRAPRHAEEDFLSAGGHSLTAMILARQLCDEFGSDAISVRDVFTVKTPQGIASRVTRGTVAPTPDTLPSHGRFPAHSAQRRLWFLEGYDEDRLRAYNMVEVFDLAVAVTPDQLRDAVAVVSARHTALRTTFEMNEDLVQVVAPDTEAPVPVDVTDDDLSDVIDRCRVRRFALDEGPLWNVTWLPRERRLVLCLHHSIADGWSIAVIVRDLIEALDGGADRPTPMPYHEHSSIVSSRLAGAAGDTARRYWNDALADLPIADLPLNRRRPSRRSSSGGEVVVDLGIEVHERLKALCRSRGVTPFAGVVAVVRALMVRWYGNDDVPLGTVTAGRDDPRVADSVGLYANTVVLRSRWDGNASFADAIVESSRSLTGAMLHQDYPFDQLVADLGVERSAGRHPVFDVLVESVFSGLDPVPGGESVVASVPVDVAVCDFDLIFGYDEAGRVHIGYRDDVLDPATVERAAAQLVFLLDQFLADPHRPVGVVELLPEEQRHFLLKTVNDTAAPFPESATLLDLVEAQVRRSPDHTAVVHGDTRLSFAELNQRADRLAAHLAAVADAGPGRLVAIVCDRTEWMVVGLLAVLKTGSAFMPVDPEQPLARIRAILSAAPASAVLCDLPQALDIATAVPVVIRPGDDVGTSSRCLAPSTGPRDLAYVVHTSGSTGTPKGVMVENRGIVNSVHYRANYYGFDADTRILQVPPIHFDSGISDVFSALIAGSTVVVISRDRLLDAAEVAAEIERHRITHVMLVPSLYQVLLERAASALDQVRQLVVVGESLPDSLAQRHARLLPETALYNEYGPAEDSVWTTVHRVNGDDILIGHPIANKSVDLLDSQGRLVPLGHPGEICIGGAGVARGYLNAETLTNERFIANPVRPGERMYRTGDLAVREESGLLRYLGRVDDQVKIRGQRVEPAEVASILSRLTDVDAAAVIAMGNRDDVRLAAYVVGDARETEMREHLARHLPNAMMPAVFVRIDELPLTANGKLDRSALPVANVRSGDAGTFNGIEAEIAAVWSDILGHPVTDPDANLFEIGGHSLVAARIAQRLGVSARVVMERQTVRALASVVPSLAPVVPEPRAERPLPVVFPLTRTQRRIWSAARRGHEDSYVISDLVRLGRSMDADAFTAAVRHVTAVQRQLRAQTRWRDGDVEQVILDSLPDGPPLMIVDLPGSAPSDAIVTAELANARSVRFDTAIAPLWQVRLLRGVDGGDLMTVTAHHLIYDGASVDILTRSIVESHDAILAGVLPAALVGDHDLADAVVSERAWLASTESAEHLEFWEKRLAAAPTAPDIVDTTRRGAERGANGLVRREIPWEIAERASATPYVLSVAAFVAMMHRQVGVDDLVLGFPVSTRTAETDRLVGCFVNAVPLRLSIESTGNLGDLLAHVAERVSEAQAHSRVPFDDIVERLRITASPGRSILYDVGVTWENATVHDAMFEVEDVTADTTLAHADLWLYGARYGDQLRFDLAYDTRLVTDEEATRIIDALADLAVLVATRPRSPIAGPPAVVAVSPWSDTHYDF